MKTKVQPSIANLAHHGDMILTSQVLQDPHGQCVDHGWAYAFVKAKIDEHQARLESRTCLLFAASLEQPLVPATHTAL